MEHSGFFLEKRQAVGLSQSRIGELLNYSPQSVSSWESGRSFPDLSIWSKYASILKVDLEGFIFAKSEKKNDYCDVLPFDKEKFSDSLKQLRKKNNLTLNDLAKLIKVNVKTISSWEKGMSFPNLSAFIGLCNLYQLNANELYFTIQISKVVESRKPLKKKRIFVPIILPIIIVGGIATGTTATIVTVENRRARQQVLNQTFTVSWLNYDGSILETDESVKYGSIPTYDGQIPIKENDLTTTYEFNGWSPSISEIYQNTTYIATYISHDKTQYHVHLNPNGAEIDVDELMFYDEEDLTLPNISKPGYHFLGWYDENDNKIISQIYDFKRDLELTARWEIIHYDISYALEGGNSDELVNKYTIEDEIILPTPILLGHTFDGWYDENDNKIVKIAKGTTGNIRLTARWNANNYKIILHGNGADQADDVLGIDYGTLVNLPNFTRKGYNFLGWYDENDNKISSGIYSFTNDISLTARWEIIQYQITYGLNGGAFNKEVVTSYTIDSETIVLETPTKEGNIFTGWYDSNNNQITEIPSGSNSDINIIARWKTLENAINVITSDESKGTAELVNIVNDIVNIKATANENCYFRGWFDENNNCVSKKDTYNFAVPDQEYTITALFYNDEEMIDWNIKHGVIPTLVDENTYITYGLYPQTVVDDEELITNLESSQKEESEPYYYFNEDYYLKMAVTSTNPNYKFSSGSIIESKEYWFKAEPIKWNVIQSSDNNYFLISNQVLDFQVWDKTEPGFYITSHLRSWLITTFYQSAFYLNNEHINEIEVDNSSASTVYNLPNPYASENTFDKVFALSALELNTLYSTNIERARTPTDYAKALGISYASLDNNAAEYWTRSPNGAWGYDIIRVTYDGRVSGYLTVDTKCGVVPGIKITIN